MRTINYKLNQILFEVYVDDETGKVEIDEWHVRTIKKNKFGTLTVFAVIKCSLTWGKLSRKNGDFGWLKNIPTHARRSTPQGKAFYALFTTKRQALVHAEKDASNPDSFMNPEAQMKAKKSIRIMISRIKSKPKPQ